MSVARSARKERVCESATTSITKRTGNFSENLTLYTNREDSMMKTWASTQAGSPGGTHTGYSRVLLGGGLQI